jgi:hypothetical protein
MLFYNMSFEDRRESLKRVFQSILDRLRVKFEGDIPDDFELLSDVICQTRKNVAIEQSLGNYKLTSIAVWKLAKDADLLEQLSEHDHITNGGEMRTTLREEGFYWTFHYSSYSPMVEQHFACHGTSKSQYLCSPKFHSPLLPDHSGPPRSHIPKQLRTRLGNKRPRMRTVGQKPQLLPRRGIR